MVIVITGATSFLGSHLIRFLVSEGATIFATYRTRDGRLEELQKLPRLNLIQLDVGKRDAFQSLPERADALVHVAAASIPGPCGIGDLISANIIGTQNVVRYAKTAGIKKIIYTSTISVYGEVSVATLEEDSPITNPCDYGLTKYMAERVLAETEEIPSAALRLPGVLGQGAHRAWIPSLVAGVLQGNRKANVYHPESLFNNAVHVDEISRFVWRLINSPLSGFQALNVAADDQMTIRDVIQLLAETLGEKIEIAEIPARKSSFTISSARAKRLGYETRSVGEILRSYFVEAGLGAGRR